MPHGGRWSKLHRGAGAERRVYAGSRGRLKKEVCQWPAGGGSRCTHVSVWRSNRE